MNQWSGCMTDSLSLIYHSVETAGFNEPTRVLWGDILNEIGEELDRRREGARHGEARWYASFVDYPGTQPSVTPARNLRLAGE